MLTEVIGICEGFRNFKNLYTVILGRAGSFRNNQIVLFWSQDL